MSNKYGYKSKPRLQSLDHVTILIIVFCDVTQCGWVDRSQRHQHLEGSAVSVLYLEDGGSRFVWNIGTYQSKYTVLHRRRQ
jgi:hypothetical protein